MFPKRQGSAPRERISARVSPEFLETGALAIARQIIDHVLKEFPSIKFMVCLHLDYEAMPIRHPHDLELKGIKIGCVYLWCFAEVRG